jgi:hypothetical protein
VSAVGGSSTCYIEGMVLLAPGDGATSSPTPAPGNNGTVGGGTGSGLLWLAQLFGGGTGGSSWWTKSFGG